MISMMDVFSFHTENSSNRTKMDQIQEVVKPAKDFIKDSIRLVKRCTKPDRKGECFKMMESELKTC